ncbi:DNA-directed RNA polymerase sigma-70 factor (plasmid) [Fulvitalea axinellae]|uniref:DNA-directed RNA polymerase sigma-70 factor n=1 Tax=Fulvitalea axinellae TaxID=1182444 RepID=A0AAU9CV82_9BACT|nr:DNA-directed RNA polymerase sigma-70 factor [Fulvitalea axinellae]
MFFINSNRFLLIQKRNKRKAYEELFDEFYEDLCRYVSQIVKSGDTAEDIVQDLFVELWNKPALDIRTSLKPYLFRAAFYRAVNVLNKKHEFFPGDSFLEMVQEESDNEDEKDSRLEQIRKAVEKLPLQRREVFCLSKYSGMSNQEIADYMGLSVRTVETHLYKSLKSLRKALAKEAVV